MSAVGRALGVMVGRVGGRKIQMKIKESNAHEGPRLRSGAELGAKASQEPKALLQHYSFSVQHPHHHGTLRGWN